MRLYLYRCMYLISYLFFNVNKIWKLWLEGNCVVFIDHEIYFDLAKQHFKPGFSRIRIVLEDRMVKVATGKL